MLSLLAAFHLVPIVSLGAAWPFCPDPLDDHTRTATNVDLNYLFGDWYEAINTQFWNEEKCAMYSFAPSFANSTGSARDLEWWAFDYLKYFRSSVSGPAQFHIGRSDRWRGAVNSLRVIRFSLTNAITPFWIYKVGPVHKHYTGDNCEVYRSQYEYLVVSNWEQYPVVVLVRNREVFRTHYEREVMQFLTNSSFPFPKITGRGTKNSPLYSDYSTCRNYTKNEIKDVMDSIQRFLK